LYVLECGSAGLYICNSSYSRQETLPGHHLFDNTHTSATRRPRLPTPPRCTLTFCAPHAHPLLPTAMAFVSYGFVLVRVRVRPKSTLPSAVGQQYKARRQRAREFALDICTRPFSEWLLRQQSPIWKGCAVLLGCGSMVPKEISRSSLFLEASKNVFFHLAPSIIPEGEQVTVHSL